MKYKGDTEYQAHLRDKLIKAGNELSGDIFVSKILNVLKPQMRLLDIGCGTGHIIGELARHHEDIIFIGLDISAAMLNITKVNNKEFLNIIAVETDGLSLPFSDASFDVVITRLAEYSPKEAYRVLKLGGYFFEYGLGPEADKEIKGFFPDRIEEENFFFTKDIKKWKDEVCEKVIDVGFTVEEIDDYKEDDYHKDEEELMDNIEMVPLVKNFDRGKDRSIIDELVNKYRENKGIRTSWHYYIVIAKRI
jgi:ubiquinone/menaquinone biosynthesis C-methylase UbiE